MYYCTLFFSTTQEFEIYLKTRIAEKTNKKLANASKYNSNFYASNFLPCYVFGQHLRAPDDASTTTVAMNVPSAARYCTVNGSRTSVYFTPTESADQLQPQVSPIHINYIADHDQRPFEFPEYLSIPLLDRSKMNAIDPQVVLNCIDNNSGTDESTLTTDVVTSDGNSDSTTVMVDGSSSGSSNVLDTEFQIKPIKSIQNMNVLEMCLSHDRKEPHQLSNEEKHLTSPLLTVDIDTGTTCSNQFYLHDNNRIANTHSSTGTQLQKSTSSPDLSFYCSVSELSIMKGNCSDTYENRK